METEQTTTSTLTTETKAPTSTTTTAAEVPTTATSLYPKEDWRHSLPADIQGNENIKRINDVQTLATSFVNAQSLLGKDKVPLPGKHASEQDWQAFYDALGRPALDKYEVAGPKDAKYIEKEWLAELKPIAHKAGILPSQLESVLEWYEKKTGGTLESMEKARKAEVEKGLNALKDEWGKAHDQNLSYAKNLIREFSSPELNKYLDESGLGNDANLIRLLAKVGESLYKEDGMVSGQPGGKPMYDPRQAIEKANEIIGASDHPYHKPEHPNHAAAKKEVAELFAMAYPQAEA